MRTLISICLVFVLVGCKKNVLVSDCINSKIDEFKMSPVCNNASVKEYEFQDKLVYVFYVGNCPDGGAAVWDGDCNFLGTLGGFVGNTKIDEVVFETNAKYKRTIWHN